jgi:heterodisulfide reductase subunit C
MKLEAGARNSLVERIREMTGENVLACYQCGKCSAGCPLASFMDILPNQVIRLVQLGVEDVLECKAIWLCASCFTCAARCPKGIDLCRVMEGLRRIQLRSGVQHLDIARLPTEALNDIPQQGIISGLRKFTG